MQALTYLTPDMNFRQTCEDARGCSVSGASPAAVDAYERALGIYGQRIRAGNSAAIADLIDSSALQGGDTGSRFAELAAAWDRHIDDKFCSFNDLHASASAGSSWHWPGASRYRRATARPRASSAFSPAAH